MLAKLVLGGTNFVESVVQGEFWGNAIGCDRMDIAEAWMSKMKFIYPTDPVEDVVATEVNATAVMIVWQSLELHGAADPLHCTLQCCR